MSSDVEPTYFIHDAGLLIDLCEGGILSPWFNSEARFVTTVLVIEELKDVRHKKAVHKFIEDGRLCAEDIDGDDLREMAEWAHASRVSLQDASVALLARKRKGVLLSGDKRLRERARREGIDVRGTIWILDVLVEARSISPALAAMALQKMVSAGARLPKDEYEQRLAHWRPANA